MYLPDLQTAYDGRSPQKQHIFGAMYAAARDASRRGRY